MKRLVMAVSLVIAVSQAEASTDGAQEGPRSASLARETFADQPFRPFTRATSHAHLRQQQFMLSGLWAFASLNYLYCDVVGLMDAKMLNQYVTGKVEGVKLTEGFLLGSTIYMQVPLSMVFLSAMLPPRHARIANIAAGSLMTVAQGASLLVGKPRSYYRFSSVVEMATTGFIAVYSLVFQNPPEIAPVVELTRKSVALKVSFSF